MHAVTLQQISRALSGDISGGQVLAPGPGHSTKDRSLSIKLETGAPGGFLVHSFSGDDPILCKDYVREKLGLPVYNQRTAHSPRSCEPQAKVDEARRTEAALTIWNAAGSADGSLVETYLFSRGLHATPPPSLRFHTGLKHRSGSKWPAMVALVTRGSDDAPLAIHRTFLGRDGNDKAPVDPQRMMLGPCRGGVVKLAPAGNPLMVGEGIETCLSAMQAKGYAAWAALSTSGLRALDLPDDVQEVIVLADSDQAGEAAARYAAKRWWREGRSVRIALPPHGCDFNDMLLNRASNIEEAV